MDEAGTLSDQQDQYFTVGMLKMSQPYYAQECAIIEANGLPYIDLRHYPVTGMPRNVAEAVLDSYLPS